MELVSGQNEIGSFREEIIKGRLGTVTIYPRPDISCERRLWLAVLMRVAQDAENEAWDVDDEAERATIQIAATLFLTRISEDLLSLGEFLGLSREQVVRLVGLKPSQLLTNLKAWRDREEREERLREGLR